MRRPPAYCTVAGTRSPPTPSAAAAGARPRSIRPSRPGSYPSPVYTVMYVPSGPDQIQRDRSVVVHIQVRRARCPLRRQRRSGGCIRHCELVWDRWCIPVPVGPPPCRPRHRAPQRSPVFASEGTAPGRPSKNTRVPASVWEFSFRGRVVVVTSTGPSGRPRRSRSDQAKPRPAGRCIVSPTLQQVRYFRLRSSPTLSDRSASHTAGSRFGQTSVQPPNW
jgi:hypothetical protein